MCLIYILFLNLVFIFSAKKQTHTDKQTLSPFVSNDSNNNSYLRESFSWFSSELATHTHTLTNVSVHNEREREREWVRERVLRTG